MITLAERGAFLGTMSKMSQVGLFPFTINIKEGRLSKANDYTKAVWLLALLFRTAYIAQSYYHLVSIYLLKSNHVDPSPLHFSYIFSNPIIMVLEVSLSVFKTDSFLLVFHELFKPGKS